MMHALADPPPVFDESMTSARRQGVAAMAVLSLGAGFLPPRW